MLSDVLLGVGIGVLFMLIVCVNVQMKAEKKWKKKLSMLEEKAELKAYRQIMKNLTIRKDI